MCLPGTGYHRECIIYKLVIVPKFRQAVYSGVDRRKSKTLKRDENEITIQHT